MDRRKEFERGCVDELFRRLRKLGQLPDSLADGERPDFTFILGNKRIGLEVTRAVYQELARGMKIQAEEYANEAMIITNLKDGPRRRSNAEIAVDAFSISDEPVWKSCEDEMREWGEKMELTLKGKRARLSRPGFRRFDENWLLICDYPPLASDDLTYTEASKSVYRLFSELASPLPVDFDRVFILSGRYLFF